jgi:hypothetical protein
MLIMHIFINGKKDLAIKNLFNANINVSCPLLILQWMLIIHYKSYACVIHIPLICSEVAVGLCSCTFLLVEILWREKSKVKYYNLCTKKSLKLVYVEQVESVFPMLVMKVYMKFWIYFAS